MKTFIKPRMVITTHREPSSDYVQVLCIVYFADGRTSSLSEFLPPGEVPSASFLLSLEERVLQEAEQFNKQVIL